MSIQNINVSTPNDGLGDVLRDAFIKVNANFAELATLVNAGATQIELDAAVAVLQDSIDDIYNILTTKSDVGHTHIIADIQNLQSTLNNLVTNSTFNSSIAAINALIIQINDDITALENDVIDIQNDILSLQAKDIDLQNQITGITWNQVINQGPTVSNQGSFVSILKSGLNNEHLLFSSKFTGDDNTGYSKFNLGYGSNEWFRYDTSGGTIGTGIILYPDGLTNINSFNSTRNTDVNIQPESINLVNSESSITSNLNISAEKIELTQSNGVDIAILNLDLQNGLSLSTDNGSTFASVKGDNLTDDRVYQFPDYSGTLTTQEYADAKLLTKQNLPTGFLTGLTLNINPFDNTKFDIAPGAYVISDFSNLQAITTQIIQLPNGITGVTPTYLTVTGVNASYIALDVNQNVVQSSSPFDNNQRRSLAILGAVIHSNHININTTNEIKAPIVAPTNQLHDFIRAVGALNLNGNVFSPNGANLKLNKSAGQIWGLGINGGNYLDPHRLTLSGQTALTFRYRLSNGTEFADTTDLNPTQYESSPGVLTALSNNNRWSVQHVNIFQSGLVRVQYAQHEYTSFDQAIAKMFVEDFVVEQNIAENSIFRAYIVMKKTTTDLAADIIAGNAAIVSVDKFGNAVGGPGNALTAAAILSALGYTPENVANKVTTFSSPNNTTYPTTQAVTNSFIAKHDGATYDTNAIQTLTQAEYNAISGSTSSSTLYFII